jgi:hypothetical protein
LEGGANMFDYKYKIPKVELKTTFGSVCVRNIIFDPNEIEKALPDIVFNDVNLMHMFAEDDLSELKKRNIYKRFAPRTKNVLELEQFVDNGLALNKNFYSFLAEGILSLIFRDIYDYQLAKGVIDVNDTLNDTHTGVDACMYNLENNVIVLGEAKFYGDLSAGLTEIIKDFTQKNIKNKLESLQIATEICLESSSIIIKNLGSNAYEELTIEQFINQKIIFAGFVLHSESSVSKYGNNDFYDSYEISVELLTQNIKKVLKLDELKGEYEIVMVHLPVSNKKTLIAKIIEASQSRLKAFGGRNE